MLGFRYRSVVMCHDDGCPALYKGPDACPDLFLRHGVKIGGGFVQDQIVRILQHGPGNGNALLFASGELLSVETDVEVESSLMGGDQVFQAGQGDDSPELFFLNIPDAIADIVADTSFEKAGVLADNAEAVTPGAQGHLVSFPP